MGTTVFSLFVLLLVLVIGTFLVNMKEKKPDIMVIRMEGIKNSMRSTAILAETQGKNEVAASLNDYADWIEDELKNPK